MHERSPDRSPVPGSEAHGFWKPEAHAGEYRGSDGSDAGDRSVAVPVTKRSEDSDRARGEDAHSPRGDPSNLGSGYCKRRHGFRKQKSTSLRFRPP